MVPSRSLTFRETLSAFCNICPVVLECARVRALIQLCFMGVREAVSAAEVSGKALELI